MILWQQIKTAIIMWEKKGEKETSNEEKQSNSHIRRRSKRGTTKKRKEPTHEEQHLEQRPRKNQWKTPAFLSCPRIPITSNPKDLIIASSVSVLHLCKWLPKTPPERFTPHPCPNPQHSDCLYIKTAHHFLSCSLHDLTDCPEVSLPWI